MTSNTTIYPLDGAELEAAVLELELEVATVDWLELVEDVSELLVDVVFEDEVVTVSEMLVEVVFEVETVEDVGTASELLLVVVLDVVDDVTIVSGLFVVVFDEVIEDVVTDVVTVSELLLEDDVVVALSNGTAWPSKTAREGKIAFT